jgi:hypothetical protein
VAVGAHASEISSRRPTTDAGIADKDADVRIQLTSQLAYRRVVYRVLRAISTIISPASRRARASWRWRERLVNDVLDEMEGERAWT